MASKRLRKREKHVPRITFKVSAALHQKAHDYAMERKTTLSDLMKYLLIKEMNNDSDDQEKEK
jgi:hypothetical protein